MEEYNLDRDAMNYQSALAAYNNSLLNQRNLQEKLEKQKDDAHDGWATPIEVLAGDAAKEPIKNLVQKGTRNLVKKGLAKGEEIVRDRASQLGTRLSDQVRARIPEGSRLDGVLNDLGAPPRPPAPALEPDTTPAPSTVPRANVSTGKDIDFQNTTANDFKDANDALKARFNALTPEGQANVQREYNQATKNLYNADKPPKDFNITDFRQRGEAMQNAIKNQEAKDAGTGDGADFDDSSLQTPRNISQSGEADSRIADFTSDLEGKGAQVAERTAKTAGTTLAEAGGEETAAAAADAAAAGEAGLNPVADLVALGLSIGALFGAAHKAPAAQIPFRPINPTISHGI